MKFSWYLSLFIKIDMLMSETEIEKYARNLFIYLFYKVIKALLEKCYFMQEEWSCKKIYTKNWVFLSYFWHDARVIRGKQKIGEACQSSNVFFLVYEFISESKKGNFLE